MSEEIMYLHSPGALPGIPGESHGPGLYLVNYEVRTARPATATDIGLNAVKAATIFQDAMTTQQEALPTTAVDGMSEEAPSTTSIPDPESVPSLAPVEDTASG